MRDDWFGHRDPFTGDEIGDRDEWLSWDHALVSAFQTIESYTDEYGLHAWEVADEAVEVMAVSKTNKFMAAKERIERNRSKKKNYTPPAGEYFVPEVKTRRSGNAYWTFDEWVKHETDKIEEDTPSE